MYGQVFETLPNALFIAKAGVITVEEDKQSVDFHIVGYGFGKLKSLSHLSFSQDRGAFFNFVDNDTIGITFKEVFPELFLIVARVVVPIASGSYH